MFETLHGLGDKARQKLIMLFDGGESVRTLGRRIGPEVEHLLDWCQVAMRVTTLGQMVKGAAPDGCWGARVPSLHTPQRGQFQSARLKRWS